MRNCEQHAANVSPKNQPGNAVYIYVIIIHILREFVKGSLMNNSFSILGIFTKLQPKSVCSLSCKLIIPLPP
ncbi:MAG: hypothetical protein HDT44_00605 [Ruminococcaceae bacterium]|nr:hypothetical protein [Oscillospiraceae bacterium]